MAPGPVEVAPGNVAMSAAWNGEDGEHWSRWESLYDRSVAWHHRALLGAARIGPADRVLDVGCGNGQVTRDAATIAVNGAALGIDLSARLIDNARRTARDGGLRNATFVHGDAQVYRFPAAAYDVAVSRTGTMFFSDPIAAFTNIARALRPGGRLALLVWQAPAENEWISEILHVLAAGRTIPPAPAGAPGPFSMADPEQVRARLDQSGFTTVEAVRHRAPMCFGSDPDEALRFISSLGLARSMLASLQPRDRTLALDALRQSVQAHHTTDGVLYDSATWVITATRRTQGAST